jgi:hypothetical protein
MHVYQQFGLGGAFGPKLVLLGSLSTPTFASMSQRMSSRISIFIDFFSSFTYRLNLVQGLIMASNNFSCYFN